MCAPSLRRAAMSRAVEQKPGTHGLPAVRPLWAERDREALEVAMARVRRLAERRKAREAEIVAVLRENNEARRVIEELTAAGVTLRAKGGTVLASPAKLVNGHATAIQKFKGAIIVLLELEGKT